jgi:inorganic phosphate transporter, PiT family
MVSTIALVFVGVGLALFFDFLNGFHDAANAIATIVVTKVLTIRQAVLMAAFANFIGAFVFTVAVAETIGKGIVDPAKLSVLVVISALIGAIVWDIITWLLGLPTSSSHALIGGLIGSVIITGGLHSLNYLGILKIFFFIFVAPVLGFIGAAFFTVLIMNIFKRHQPFRINILFRKMQLLSSFFYSLGHGTNDAQKTMGIIALLLFSAGLMTTFHIPVWVILSCHAAIALGTYFGGWRIVKTMGTKIAKLRPFEGFCAETAGGLVLMGTAIGGVPVSTTHVISGSIIGVGTVENVKTVGWTTARRMIWAWILTIPAAAIFSILSYLILHNLFLIA